MPTSMRHLGWRRRFNGAVFLFIHHLVTRPTFVPIKAGCFRRKFPDKFPISTCQQLSQCPSLVFLLFYLFPSLFLSVCVSECASPSLLVLVEGPSSHILHPTWHGITMFLNIHHLKGHDLRYLKLHDATSNSLCKMSNNASKMGTRKIAILNIWGNKILKSLLMNNKWIFW